MIRPVENMTPFQDISLKRLNIAELTDRRLRLRRRLVLWRERAGIAEKAGQEPILAEARKRCVRLLHLITRTTAAMGRLG